MNITSTTSSWSTPSYQVTSTSRDRSSGTASGEDSLNISAGGFAALMQGGGPPPMTDELAGTIGAKMQEKNPDLFAKLDRDGSGSLTAQEMEDGRDLAMQSMMGGAGGGMPSLDQEALSRISQLMQQQDPAMFGKLDADGNGQLSGEEMQGAAAMMGGGSANGASGMDSYRNNVINDILRSMFSDAETT